MEHNLSHNSTSNNALKTPGKGFTDAMPLLSDPEALRGMADRDGYLFFRGLLPKERVLGLRQQIFQVLREKDLLAEGATGDAGATDMEAVNRLAFNSVSFGIPDELYLEIQQLEEFHAIAQDPALLQAYGALFGEAAFPHPRNICRVVLPHRNAVPTPPHQDFLHIQGTPVTWTCWFPLGDCPKALGGLAMLEGSHRLGVLHVAEHGGAGGLETLLCGYDLDWAYDDYAAGDVIIFHSQTVHKAMPNLVGNQIRLSCDFRYQPLSEPIHPSSLQPHGTFSWEDVYKGWKDERLMYYWRSNQFAYTEWDESILKKRDRIC